MSMTVDEFVSGEKTITKALVMKMRNALVKSLLEELQLSENHFGSLLNQKIGSISMKAFLSKCEEYPFRFI